MHDPFEILGVSQDEYMKASTAEIKKKHQDKAKEFRSIIQRQREDPAGQDQHNKLALTNKAGDAIAHGAYRRVFLLAKMTNGSMAEAWKKVDCAKADGRDYGYYKDGTWTFSKDKPTDRLYHYFERGSDTDTDDKLWGTLVDTKDSVWVIIVGKNTIYPFTRFGPSPFPGYTENNNSNSQQKKKVKDKKSQRRKEQPQKGEHSRTKSNEDCGRSAHSNSSSSSSSRKHGGATKETGISIPDRDELVKEIASYQNDNKRWEKKWNEKEAEVGSLNARLDEAEKSGEEQGRKIEDLVKQLNGALLDVSELRDELFRERLGDSPETRALSSMDLRSAYRKYVSSIVTAKEEAVSDLEKKTTQLKRVQQASGYLLRQLEKADENLKLKLEEGERKLSTERANFVLQLQESKGEKERAQKETDRTKKKLKEVSRSYDKEKMAASLLQKEARKLRQKNEELENERNKKTREINSVQSDLKAAADEKSKLANKLSALEDEKGRNREALSKRDASIKGLQEQLQTQCHSSTLMQEKIRLLEQKNRELESQLKSKSIETQTLSSSLKSANTSQNKELLEYKGVVKELEGQLQEGSSLAAIQKEQIGKLQQEMTVLKVELVSSTEKVKGLDSSLMLARTSELTLNSKLNSLQDEKRRDMEALSERDATIKALQENLRAEFHKLDKLTFEKEKLKAELEKTNGESEKLASLLSASKAQSEVERKTHQEQLQTASHSVDILQEQLDKLTLENGELITELAKKTREAEDCQKHLDLANGAKLELASKLESLQAANEKQKDKNHEESQKSASLLEEQLAKLTLKNGELSTELSQKTGEVEGLEESLRSSNEEKLKLASKLESLPIAHEKEKEKLLQSHIKIIEDFKAQVKEGVEKAVTLEEQINKLALKNGELSTKLDLTNEKLASCDSDKAALTAQLRKLQATGQPRPLSNEPAIITLSTTLQLNAKDKALKEAKSQLDQALAQIAELKCRQELEHTLESSHHDDYGESCYYDVDDSEPILQEMEEEKPIASDLPMGCQSLSDGNMQNTAPSSAFLSPENGHSSDEPQLVPKDMEQSQRRHSARVRTNQAKMSRSPLKKIPSPITPTPCKRRKTTDTVPVPHHTANRVQRGEFECDLCKQRYVKNETLQIHKKTDHDNWRYVCGNCKAVFKRKDILDRHHNRKVHAACSVKNRTPDMTYFENGKFKIIKTFFRVN